MTRVLFSLGSLSLILILTALVLGLSVGDLYNPPYGDEAAMDRLRGTASVHRLTGIFAAICVVFVESIIITYFVGTSRWIKEVVTTYQLEVGLFNQSAELKRKTFPWAVMGMLAVVGMGALGAASDPSTGSQTTADWTMIHFLSAFVGLVFIGYTYFIAWNNIAANHEVIQEIVTQVKNIRDERGLDAPSSILESGVSKSGAAVSENSAETPPQGIETTTETAPVKPEQIE